MRCAFDADFLDLGLAVELLCAEAGTSVRLWNRCDPWGDRSIQVCVEVAAADLRAATHGVTVGLGGDWLTPFFDELARDFAGWQGVRTWESLDHDLHIEAAFRSRGHVDLTWTVGPWRSYEGAWRAQVTTTVEAGEQLRRFAADVHRFLRPDG